MEDQLNRSCPGVSGGRQHFGCAQETGGVRIVAAGMHPTWDAAGMRTVDFLDGQGVHVGPEGNPPRTGIATWNFGDDAGGTALCTPTGGVGDAHVGQSL